MSISNSFFVTGIGTGVGKTVVSAVFAQHFQAGYWKPVQSGDLALSDSMVVGSLIDRHLKIHPERFRLRAAVSPHQAAAQEGICIKLPDFELPVADTALIVEGAGGLFVPINYRHFMIELIQQLHLPAILVVRDYLGCINHTMLSVRALQSANIPLAYIVLNGTFNAVTKAILTTHCPEGAMILELPEFERLTREEIRKVALEMPDLASNTSRISR